MPESLAKAPEKVTGAFSASPVSKARAPAAPAQPVPAAAPAPVATVVIPASVKEPPLAPTVVLIDPAPAPEEYPPDPVEAAISRAAAKPVPPDPAKVLARAEADVERAVRRVEAALGYEHPANHPARLPPAARPCPAGG